MKWEKKMSDIDIKHNTDPDVGPVDGVSVETEGVYTKFRGKGIYQKDKRIFRQETTDVGIKAAISTGVVSIYDRSRDQAIAVSLVELAEVLNEALNEAIRCGIIKK